MDEQPISKRIGNQSSRNIMQSRKMQDCKTDWQHQEEKEKSIVVRTNLDKTYETVEIDFPCLITVEKNNESPRLPSYKRSVQYSDHQMHIVTFEKFFDNDESKYGLKGSPTQVERMFNPIKDDRKVMLNEDEKSYAVQLKEILKDGKFF